MPTNFDTAPPLWGPGSSAQAAHAPDKDSHSINTHLELPLQRAATEASPGASLCPPPAAEPRLGAGGVPQAYQATRVAPTRNPLPAPASFPKRHFTWLSTTRSVPPPG